MINQDKCNNPRRWRFAVPFFNSHPLSIAAFATLCTFSLLPAQAAQEEVSTSSSKAVSASDVSANLRYRIEAVEQDDLPLRTALASTLRSRVSVTSGDWRGWQALLEVDNVAVIGNDRYNSTANGRTQYSVVPDPAGTDVNQGLLRYRTQQGTSITMGRQRVNLLNQRFIGGVGWRQNEQTFDGYRVAHQSKHGWALELSRLHNVNRIFGPRGEAANQRGEFYNMLVGYQITPQQRVDGFVHDFDFRDWAVRSSRTYGVSYRATFGPASTQLVLAEQESAHGNPDNFRHRYHLLQVSTQIAGVNWQLGQERLAGDGSSALQTPLATLHGFQGFADTFLVTPEVGVRDTFVSASFEIGTLHTQLKAHSYVADSSGGFTLGHELNATIQQPLSERLQVLYKAAYYEARQHGSDTLKAWFMLSYQM